MDKVHNRILMLVILDNTQTEGVDFIEIFTPVKYGIGSHSFVYCFHTKLAYASNRDVYNVFLH